MASISNRQPFQCTALSKQCLEASYVVAKRIGKLGKPHTISETLILPAAQDMCRIMIGDSAAAKLGAVPLSNDTVARRIEDMSNDIREQLIEFVKKSPYYALQLDESTDIAGQAELLTYVRYLRDKAIWEGCPVLPASSVAHYRSHFQCPWYFYPVKMVWPGTDALAYARMVRRQWRGVSVA